MLKNIEGVIEPKEQEFPTEAMLSSRFSFLGGRDSGREDHYRKVELLPTLKLEADKEVYRPGDPVVVTVEISNPSSAYSFLVERLSFEIKGIEKLDVQWFATQKPLPGSKQKRGSFDELCYYCWSIVVCLAF